MRRKGACRSDPSPCDGHRRGARAFVLLVAVALLLVISAMAFVQLAVTQQASIGTLRVGEEAAARSIAEGCLASASAALAQYRDACRAAGPDTCDLDGFLVGTLGGAPSVSVPAGGKPWGFFARGDGACLVRIDDNPDEGVDAGLDLPDDDQDLALTVTVIGLHPVRGVPPDSAYARAHARVTLRRALSLENTGSVALSAPRVDMSGISRVCGSGGVSGDDIDVADASCACGSIISLAAPLVPTAGCACELAPDETPYAFGGSYTGCADTVTSSAYEPADVWSQTAAPDILLKQRFHGRPEARHNARVTSPINECRFFLERDGLVFLWDNRDDDPLDVSELGTLPGALASTTIFECKPGSECADPPAGCSSLKDPAEGPCEWKQFLSSLTLPIECKANQTPCWKPVAHVGTGVHRTSLETLITAWDATVNGGDGAVEVYGGGLSFRQDKKVFLTTRSFRAASGSMDTVCGDGWWPDDPACRDCDGSSANTSISYSGDWLLTAAANNPTMPVPLQLFVDDSRNVTVAGAGKNDNPEGRALYAGIVTNGTVTVRNGAQLGIGSIDAGRFVATAGNPLDSLSTCRPAFSFDPPGAPGVRSDPYGITFAKVISADRCVFEDVGLLYGDIRCNELDWGGTGCIIGRIASDDDGRTVHLHPTSGYFYATDQSNANDLRLGGALRMRHSGSMPFQVRRDAEVYGNATMFGAIEAERSITLRERGRVFRSDALDSQRAVNDVIEVPW